MPYFLLKKKVGKENFMTFLLLEKKRAGKLTEAVFY